MSKKDKKRVDLDVRPEGPWFSNYDYGGSDKPSKTSPGKGLYNGKMDKYKSVRDFINMKRKSRRELKNATYTSDQLLRAANRFSQLVAQQGLPSGGGTSGDATTLSQALKDAGVWDPFNPATNPNGKKLFAILDKYNFQGKLSTSLTVDNKLGVKVTTTGANDKIAAEINAVFAPQLSAALKKQKANPPTETMTFGWLENVG